MKLSYRTPRSTVSAGVTLHESVKARFEKCGETLLKLPFKPEPTAKYSHGPLPQVAPPTLLTVRPPGEFTVRPGAA